MNCSMKGCDMPVARQFSEKYCGRHSAACEGISPTTATLVEEGVLMQPVMSKPLERSQFGTPDIPQGLPSNLSALANDVGIQDPHDSVGITQTVDSQWLNQILFEYAERDRLNKQITAANEGLADKLIVQLDKVSKFEEENVLQSEDITRLVSEREAFCIENKELKARLAELNSIAANVSSEIVTLRGKVEELSRDEAYNELEKRLDEALDGCQENYDMVLKLRKQLRAYQKADAKTLKLVRKLDKLYPDRS